MHPVLACDLVGKSRAHVVVFIEPPREDKIPIVAYGEGYFREHGPAAALTRERVAT